jgi:FAD/FMN-containing dehydrogenase
VVVRPRHTDEVEATLAVARDTGTPITMRGAGTSIAGNAVGAGIVIDTSRHLNRVLDLNREERTARCSPASCTRRCNGTRCPWACASGPTRRRHTRCTIGGMVGNNACGSRRSATAARSTTSKR